jgi:hypothetical protein
MEKGQSSASDNMQANDTTRSTKKFIPAQRRYDNIRLANITTIYKKY